MKKAVQAGFRKDVLDFKVGDTVDVAVRIVEGEKERTQVFTGTVISRRRGGISENFTVRRIVNNEGVERTFPLHSPRIAGIKVVRGGKVRRAKLYFLRQRIGKATRLKEQKRKGRGIEVPSSSDAKAPAAAREPVPEKA